ncbi:SIN3 binding STB2 [Fusarium beomiforme]|uniref:SIN3 binding STB2 n=1 Tax=Fusarium beomiforme TaxID=44412 RepID=A0A9P5AKY3_9HYPO|nr:SIN3 binding STB2 [Fusarium beomiforme]
MAFRFPDPRLRVDDELSTGATAKGSVARSATASNPSTTRESPPNGIPPLEVSAYSEATDYHPLSSPKRKNLVFADPFAFRYLEEGSNVVVVERRGILRGYESYLVEQWACSRKPPTLLIVTYTGDEKHSVVVGVLSVPVDENLWPPRLRFYFDQLQDSHARPKETELGELMVTNLSNFPSALTVIMVPEGDIRKYRSSFIVNEDLKRLGCSGRSGMTLSDPTEATQLKFLQLYRTSDRVPVPQAVVELIKLCQVTLYMFDKLGHQYIDGLLCDKTEMAINNWWIEIGAEHYNFEPTDGILGPSTVAALLGMFMGARNRLHWYGAPVSKDAFDLENTKRGIGHFQKSQKLEKTRRLDRQTLLKLYSVSAKAAAGESWGVQRAVKSTLTEVGGKRGEIVMGMVSGKDKGGLADIETLDIGTFASLAYGERPKWLWLGKPRRSVAELPHHSPELSSAVPWKEEEANPNPKRVHSAPAENELDPKRLDESLDVYSGQPPGSAVSVVDGSGDKEASRKNIFKGVAGKMNDARSGFGRIKDVVGGGLRGHNSRPSVSTRDDFPEGPRGSSQGLTPGTAQPPAPTQGVGRAFTWNNKPQEYLAAMKRADAEGGPGFPQLSQFASTSTVDLKQPASAPIEIQKREQEAELFDIGVEVRKDVLSKAPSAVGSLVDEHDLQGPVLDAELKDDLSKRGLSRRHSIQLSRCPNLIALNENRWPRRMSFSDAEEAILEWEPLIDVTDAAVDLAGLEAFNGLAHHFNQCLEEMKYRIEPWVTEKLSAVEALDEHYARDKEDLHALYYQLNEACQRMRITSHELLAEERSHLTEGLKEVESLVARLDYEVQALLQKVVDVEDGIVTFEKQVEDMEKRAEALKVQLETEGWLHWMFRTVTGIGTGPDITRSPS